jgi:hypothetical protein
LCDEGAFQSNTQSANAAALSCPLPVMPANAGISNWLTVLDSAYAGTTTPPFAPSLGSPGDLRRLSRSQFDQHVPFFAHDRAFARKLELARDPHGLVPAVLEELHVSFGSHVRL